MKQQLGFPSILSTVTVLLGAIELLGAIDSWAFDINRGYGNPLASLDLEKAIRYC